MVRALEALRGSNRFIFDASATVGVLALITAAGVFIDDRTVASQNVWIKPLKFSISFSIYLLTIAWIIQYLPGARRSNYSFAFVTFVIVEIVAIYIQAFRGQPSHHNFSTLLNGLMYGSMGVAIALNTLLLIPLIFELKGSPSVLPLAYLRSLQLGIVMTILSSLIGLAMSVKGAHSIGGSDGGLGVPFFNWSLTLGDLRFAHFLGMHGIQGLIAIGYVTSISLREKISESLALSLVTTTFLAFIFVVSLSLYIAFRGKPFFYPLNFASYSESQTQTKIAKSKKHLITPENSHE